MSDMKAYKEELEISFVRISTFIPADFICSFRNVLVTNKGLANVISMIVINKIFCYSLSLFKLNIMYNISRRNHSLTFMGSSTSSIPTLLIKKSPYSPMHHTATRTRVS